MTGAGASSVTAGSTVPSGGSVVLSLSGKTGDGRDFSVAFREEGVNLFVPSMSLDRWIYWSK